MNSLKVAIKGKDADKIKRGMESLEKMAQKLAEEAYKATDPNQKASSEEPADFVNPTNQEKKKDNKDDIIDADFTAVDTGSSK